MVSFSKPKVLFIAGTGRSGSTLIGSLLGTVRNAVAVGEVRFLWERGLIANQTCGCGEVFMNCEFWKEVLARVEQRVDGFDPERIARTLAKTVRIRRLPGLLYDGADLDVMVRESIYEVYESISTISGNAVIIDSSKLPTYAMLLAEDARIDLKILHVVRDPRASAWSWMRGQKGANSAAELQIVDERMDRFSPLKSSLLWSLWNTTAKNVFGSGDYQLLRYEDFVERPRETIVNTSRFAGLDVRDEIFTDPDKAILELSHTVAGNPNRFHRGVTRIVSDDEWHSAMPRSSRLLVTAITRPVLRSLGYPTSSAR